MKEIKAIINQLGPIEDQEMFFAPFMVLTGGSGLGKSYTALLWYYFLYTFSPSKLGEFINNRLPKGRKRTYPIEFSFKFSDLRRWLNNGTSRYIGYLLGNNDFSCDVNFTIDIDDDEVYYIKSKPSDEEKLIEVSINGSSRYFPLGFNDPLFTISFVASSFFMERLFDKHFIMPLLLPPARAAFIGGNPTRPSVGMYLEFLNQLSYLKASDPINNADDQFFKSMITKLADGDIIMRDGESFLKLDNVDNPIPISSAASSVKELAPLFYLLQNHSSLDRFSIVFEEPEAHVHPTKQYAVMDIIARCLNKGMFIQMTSHSDYLLTRMNQLIRLGRIRKKDPKLFEEYCDKFKHNRNLFIDPDIVNGYYFKRNEETKKVEIQKLNTASGIDFLTFNDIVKKQMALDIQIDDYLSKAGLESN